MTVQQLIELSILDAMALLDEDERLLFESAFRKATPGVQAHVRREQTRLSRIESLLPDVQPPAGLRAIVLEAVRAHMASEVADDGLSNLAIPMTQTRRVNSLWRAGALGLAAACVMLGITTFLVQSQFTTLSEQLQHGNMIDAMSREFGPSFVRDVLFDRDTERVVLTSDVQGFKGEAALFINPEWDRARFFCQSMSSPKGQNLKLAIIDDSGQVLRVLQEFTSNGELKPIDIPLEPGMRGHVAVVVAGAVPGSNDVIVSGEIQGKQI